MNKSKRESGNESGNLVIILLAVGLLLGIAAHFFQIGYFDVAINGLLGPTVWTYLLSTVLKVLALGYQFFMVVIGIEFILFFLGLAEGDDPKLTGNIASFLLVGYILLLVVYTILNMFWTEPQLMISVGGRWTITRSIEEYQHLSGSSWKDDMPSTAYDIECVKKRDSAKDKNRDFCTYSYFGWVTIEQMVTNGDWSQKPYVQEYEGKVCSSDEIYLGCIRGISVRKIWVTAFRDGHNAFSGEPYMCELNFSDWSQLPNGAMVDMQVGKLDGTVRCRVSNIKPSVWGTVLPSYPYPEIKEFASQ